MKAVQTESPVKKCRVGIVTHYGANNFGAVLQCKALSTAIASLDASVDCYVLDYDRNKRTASPTPLSIYRTKKDPGIRGIIKGIIHVGIFICTYLKSSGKTPTQDFINEEMNLDTRVHLDNENKLDWGDIPAPHEALVCGSDQIWAFWSLSPYFRLETTRPTAAAKLAYAPSFGKAAMIPEEEIQRLSEELKQFAAVSCRERDGAELLSRALQQPCPVLPDPTLLHPREYWLQKARKPERFPYKEKQFVFTYRISFMGNSTKLAAQVARQLNMPLVTCDLVEPHSYYSQFGPREFLWCIANAAYVVTPSFHGTVFSIIMGTPFHVGSSFAPQERIQNLLSLLGLENRYSPDSVPSLPVSDLPPANELEARLESLRSQGLDWLRSHFRLLLEHSA